MNAGNYTSINCSLFRADAYVSLRSQTITATTMTAQLERQFERHGRIETRGRTRLLQHFSSAPPSVLAPIKADTRTSPNMPTASVLQMIVGSFHHQATSWRVSESESSIQATLQHWRAYLHCTCKSSGQQMFTIVLLLNQ